MSLCIFAPARGVDAHLLLVHQHFGKANDRVERRAQFVAHGGEEARLGRVGALGFRARIFKRLFLGLASETSRITATTSRSRCRSRPPVERTAAHLDPDEFERGSDLPLRGRLTRNSTDCGSPARPHCRAPRDRPGGRRHARGRTGRGRAVRRPARRTALRRGRNEQHRAVAAMAGDDVGHVAGQQAIAVFLRIEQPEAGAGERFRAKRETGGIERGRDDPERRERAMVAAAQRTPAHRPNAASRAGDRRRQARRSKPPPPPGARPKRGFQRHHHEPDRGKDEMPPVLQATTKTSPVSESDDRICAPS